MRRIWIVVSIAVAAVLIIVILAVSLLDVNKFRPRIQTELQSKLGRPVTLGELHLHLLPFSIQADGLSIAQSPGYSAAVPLATAKEVYVSAGLFSLLGGDPQIKDVRLNNPQIELIQNAAGVWNFASLGTGAPGSSSQSNSGVTLDELKVVNGQVAVTNERSKTARTVYNHIDLSMSGFAPGKAVNVDAALHFPGAGKELLSFRGTAGPLTAGNRAAIPVNGKLSLEEVSLAGLNAIEGGSVPANTDASMSGDADVASAGGVITCKGNLNLSNAVVRGAKATYPVNTQYDLSLNHATDQIGITSAAIKMGPTAVGVSGTINSGATPTSFNVRVQTNNASITELSRLASLFGVAFDANDQVKGSVSADLTASGALSAPEVQGTVSASTIQAQDIALTNVHANCSLKNGVVTLSPLTAGLFGGQENGTVTLDTKAAHPLCSVKAGLTGVDTNALLSAVSSMKDTLYGSLAANANLSFALDTANNLAGTLNGVLSFAVTNGQLKHVNITNELSRVGKFSGSAPAQSASGTTLQKLAATMNLSNGVAATNNLVAVMPEGSLSGNGSVNLVNQGVNMHVNAVLSSGTSKTVGGTAIGGFMNAALANNQGELVIPVIVTGSMAHPVFTPDVAAIAKMRLSHLLPNSSDPSKLANGLLGSVLGGGANGQQSKQTNKQQPNSVNSLLNGILKH